MLPLVVYQVPLRRETLTTALKFTPIRLLACMNTHVSLQVTVFSEASAADLTLERLLTSVRTHVDLKSTTARVALATNLATKRLLTGVNQHVRLKMPFGDE